MTVTSVIELVGGPRDGMQRELRGVPPWHYKIPIPAPLRFARATEPTTAELVFRYELYERDESPRLDGVWPYRYRGVR